MIDWGEVFYTAIVGFSGVFVGLILLQISTNVVKRIVAIFEKNARTR